MRVLLLSAYDAGSHRYWHSCLREGIKDWDWQLLTLPPRHFSWRIRGNPLLWSVTERHLLEQDYDLILATSMVDLATLRGLVPALASRPAVLYFHENQFAYPAGRGGHGLLEAQMVSLYSALSAQRLLFNSQYNLDTFMQGCEQMLAAFPDAVPDGVVDLLRNKAGVLPVPVPELVAVQNPGECSNRQRAGSLHLLWNHRWEYDKGPERLLAVVQGLLAEGSDFYLHVVGQQFRQQPPAFDEIKQLLEHSGKRGEWGYIADQREYLGLLGRCDVVLSTALHDFQGLALLEACAAGCSPLAPNRLVYPEWLDSQFLYTGYAAEPQREANAVVEMVLNLGERKSRGEALPLADVSRFDSGQLLNSYRSSLAAVTLAG